MRHDPSGYTVGGREAHAARRARRLLRRRRQQQPEHPPPAGAQRAVDDDDADDVQPERELRAGRPARVRGRRQLRQGGPRPRGRPRARVPARGRRRRGRLRRHRRAAGRLPDHGRAADRLRRDDADGVLPAGRRDVGAVRRADAAVDRAEPEGRHLRERLQRDGRDARRRGVRVLPAGPGPARRDAAGDGAHARAGRARRAGRAGTGAGRRDAVHARRARRRSTRSGAAPTRPTPRRSRSATTGRTS